VAVLLVLGHESPLRGPIDQLWEDEELAGDALVQAHGLKEQADQPVERSPRSQQDGSEEQAGRGCEQGLESSISGFGVEVVVGPGPRGLAVELEAKRLPQQGKLREALNDRVRAQAQAKHQEWVGNLVMMPGRQNSRHLQSAHGQKRHGKAALDRVEGAPAKNE